MHQEYVKHARPCLSECPSFPGFEVSQICSFLFLLEKDSFGPGLDALELEMSKVLPGSLNRDFKAHFLVNEM